MKENGFYMMLAVVSLVGIALTGLLVYKASKLPSIYSPKAEEIATASAIIGEGEAEPSPSASPSE